MTSATLSSRSESRSFIVFLVTALLIAFILGYIDEGYYDLRWMQNIGNWIVLGVYALCMLIGQLVFFNIFLRRYNSSGKMAMSAIFGSILGAGVLIAIFQILRPGI